MNFFLGLSRPRATSLIIRDHANSSPVVVRRFTCKEWKLWAAERGMPSMPCTGHTLGLGRSTSPWHRARRWTVGRMRSIENFIDNARVECITRIKVTCRMYRYTYAGWDRREIVDTVTTGAMRENWCLECGLSVSALDIESLSWTGRHVRRVHTCTYSVRM